MNLKQVLMERDELTSAEAEGQIKKCKADLMERIETGEDDCLNICEEYFGLEPDYIIDLM